MSTQTFQSDFSSGIACKEPSSKLKRLSKRKLKKRFQSMLYKVYKSSAVKLQPTTKTTFSAFM